MQVNAPTSRVVLNALDLRFQEVTIAGAAATQQAAVSINQNEQTATLTVKQPLGSGPAEIQVRYAGVLNDQLRGFYLSKTAGRKYAVTQFESTDARRAFPCFDEPALKATFSLTLVVDRRDTAISNGKVLSDMPGPGRTQHTVKFATSPKMSSYLVAMAVGDFRCLDGSQDGVPIRVCASPDKTSLGHDCAAVDETDPEVLQRLLHHQIPVREARSGRDPGLRSRWHGEHRGDLLPRDRSPGR